MTEEINVGDEIELDNGMSGIITTNNMNKTKDPYVTYRCDFDYCPICNSGDFHRLYGYTLQRLYQEDRLAKNGVKASERET